ncbi:hypothetical protein P8C59_004329 [Phyllachora maydis]|uniref:Methyltransferase type 11 domain-containing protein n=1 Tax=Phyllachora maydis TaxID=1825666 RepID=A0AAD9MAA5_9PEZI|nr:hypothetical protein P8C59_004329 [Phyllachora maydis]
MSNAYSLRGLHAQLPQAQLESYEYERANVHDVYDAIAPHFSATRHTPWPRVAAFLRTQPPGAVGLDVGCGNAKYLAVNGDVVLLGADRSPALTGLALARSRQQQQQQQQPAADVVVADGLALPFRARAADFLICIAVIHHLSTRARRQDAIRQLLRCAKPPPPATPPAGGDTLGAEGGQGGRVLIYVWALEQGSSRRGWDQGGEQDLLVPWVVKANRPRKGQQKHRDVGDGNLGQEGDKVFHRYYHLYREGELEEDVRAAGGEVLRSGYERDNWWIIAAATQATELIANKP